MTDKPTYEQLEQQLAQAEAKLKKVKKLEKSYVQKNIDLWKKFLAGEAGIKHFLRSSRSTKTTSKHQYFFNRGGKDCFQYKEFVKVFHQKFGPNRIQDLQRNLGVRAETISEDLKALGLSN